MRSSCCGCSFHNNYLKISLRCRYNNIFTRQVSVSTICMSNEEGGTPQRRLTPAGLIRARQAQHATARTQPQLFVVADVSKTATNAPNDTCPH